VPHYFDRDNLARQGVNECGVYALKFADIFDGDKCVEQILHYDERSKDWKAEFMYRVFFHQDNKVLLDDISEEIQCLSPHISLLPKEEELLLLLTGKQI